MKNILRKALLFAVLCALILTSLSGCLETTADPEDFEGIYRSHYAATPNLLSFSPYAYYSYLLLFPRTAPKELTEFESFFRPAVGYDKYLFRFSYTLDASSYAALSTQMTAFTVTSERGTNAVVSDTENFSRPAVILSFPGKDGERSAPFEYLLFDDSNRTVTSVFALNVKDRELTEKIPSQDLPRDFDSLRASLAPLYNKAGNYSFYCFASESGEDLYLPVGDLRYVDLFHTEGIDW